MDISFDKINEEHKRKQEINNIYSELKIGLNPLQLDLLKNLVYLQLEFGQWMYETGKDIGKSNRYLKSEIIKELEDIKESYISNKPIGIYNGELERQIAFAEYEHGIYVINDILEEIGWRL